MRFQELKEYSNTFSASLLNLRKKVVLAENLTRIVTVGKYQITELYPVYTSDKHVQ